MAFTDCNICSKLSEECYLVHVFKVFDKRNQFQLWNVVCYFGNPYVRNKSYIGGRLFVELYRVLDVFLHRASCTDTDNDP